LETEEDVRSGGTGVAVTSTQVRRWLVPGGAFVALAGSWYLANLLALAAALRTQRGADARIVASGHEPVFTTVPSLWDWQQNLRPGLFALVGAAIIAVLLRRASTRPWFVIAAVLPVVMGNSDRLHGWWAPGAGIDLWTMGAGVGVPGLDLSRFGAGPAWTLAGGTLLAVAAVMVPALLSTPPRERVSHRHVARALPYVCLLAVGAAVAIAELHIDSSGDGSSNEMLIAAGAAALIAGFAVFTASGPGFWRDITATAVAVGLVTVSGLNPGAMLSTKTAAFAAAAGIAVVSACTARRPGFGSRVPAN
jgi:hypothetical protein